MVGALGDARRSAARSLHYHLNPHTPSHQAGNSEEYKQRHTSFTCPVCPPKLRISCPFTGLEHWHNSVGDRCLQRADGSTGTRAVSVFWRERYKRPLQSRDAGIHPHVQTDRSRVHPHILTDRSHVHPHIQTDKGHVQPHTHTDKSHIHPHIQRSRTTTHTDTNNHVHPHIQTEKKSRTPTHTDKSHVHPHIQTKVTYTHIYRQTKVTYTHILYRRKSRPPTHTDR